MDELYAKEVVCPICSNKFKTSKVRRSKMRIEKRDSDLLAYYKGENPIKYSVFVCPECGYAAMENIFNKIKEKDKNIIREKVSSKWNKRELPLKRSIDDAIEYYKLALYCGQLIDLKRVQLGNICLRISWLYRIKGDDEEERFLNYSLSMFEEGYYNERFSKEGFDEITLGYLIGELYRRIGEIDKAISWFGTVVSNPLVKQKPRIEKLAREQWYVAKEQKRAGA
ncbi:DUF2225 domain-containing protein [Thermohalobacter berrensis]|uniref:DUF2225 domain-containing protein n=1 Tax=Thermohalobacter berrensis TaxID=99594 RepID=UPI000E70BD27|nr:DUF2225 domain-containing protein [Thermohalobacter berrensis]